MAHPNEDLLRRGYAAFDSGDIETVLSLLAPDITWHVGGSSKLAGNYRGHDGVSGLFTAVMELTGDTFRLDVHDVLANDTHAVVLVTSHAQRGDRELTMRAADIWHVADGKATEYWSFPEDSAENDRFFS